MRYRKEGHRKRYVAVTKRGIDFIQDGKADLQRAPKHCRRQGIFFFAPDNTSTTVVISSFISSKGLTLNFFEVYISQKAQRFHEHPIVAWMIAAFASAGGRKTGSF
jgi:hypothetical protein